MDLPKPTATGEPAERVSSSPLIQSFTTGFATRVIFTTSTPQWQDPCDKGGTSWLMELNTSCGRLNDKIGGNYKSPIDLDQSGQIDSSDLVTINGVANQSVSGVKLKTETGIVTQITWVEGEGSKGLAYKILPGSRGKVEVVTDSSDTITGGVPKRVSWEQIQ